MRNEFRLSVAENIHYAGFRVPQAGHRCSRVEELPASIDDFREKYMLPRKPLVFSEATRGVAGLGAGQAAKVRKTPSWPRLGQLQPFIAAAVSPRECRGQLGPVGPT